MSNCAGSDEEHPLDLTSAVEHVAESIRERVSICARLADVVVRLQQGGEREADGHAMREWWSIQRKLQFMDSRAALPALPDATDRVLADHRKMMFERLAEPDLDGPPVAS